MLNIIKEQKGNALVVRFSGSIGENVNFEQMIGPVSGELIINCREIPRINSVGVKSWIKYFSSLQAKGIKLTFTDCSTAIVEQINLISNFLCGGTVESIYVPFSCNSCKSELVGRFTIADIKKLQMNFPALKCTKCNGEAVFDDIPEEYLSFMNRP